MKKLISLVLLTVVLFSCKRKWTEKDKSEFVSGCLSSAVKDRNIGDSLARPYCNCLLQKIMAKYPNANDVRYIRYDTTVVAVSRDCLSRL